jgi:hypothetical protein
MHVRNKWLLMGRSETLTSREISTRQPEGRGG